MTANGRIEIGGCAHIGELSRLLTAAFAEIHESNPGFTYDADHGAPDPGGECTSAVGEGRAACFRVSGLDPLRPFETLKPLFVACRTAGVQCRVRAVRATDIQAAYSKPGGNMLWIAFQLTRGGEVRYGPSSIFCPLREGLTPTLSEWLDSAQLLGEKPTPLTAAP